MMSISNDSTYSISDEKLELAHIIAQYLFQEQQRIEPGKEGISVEISKLITYLNLKIKQKQPARFFIYLEKLVEHGEIIGHSKKTINYYKSIYEVCESCLTIYTKKPLIIAQILGWSQRLMRYYKTVGIEEEIDIDAIKKMQVVQKATRLAETSKAVKPVKTKVVTTLECPQEVKANKAILSQPVKPTKPESPKPPEAPPTTNGLQALQRPKRPSK